MTESLLFWANVYGVVENRHEEEGEPANVKLMVKARYDIDMEYRLLKNEISAISVTHGMRLSVNTDLS